jgi:thiamine kinase-like enzyme
MDRWEAATAGLAAACGPAVFCHMDLLPGNIMVAHGGEETGHGTAGGAVPAASASAPVAGKENAPLAAAAAPPSTTAPPPPTSTLLLGPGPDMQFIDFEYARPAPRGFDVGNHWCEWAGLDCEWGRYPPPAAKAAFASAYLTEASKWEVAGKRKWSVVAQAAAPPSPAAVAALVVEGDAYALASHLWWTAWALVQARVSPIAFDYGAYAASRFACFVEREEGVRAAVERLAASTAKRAGGWRRAFCVAG